MYKQVAETEVKTKYAEPRTKNHVKLSVATTGKYLINDLYQIIPTLINQKFDSLDIKFSYAKVNTKG